MTEERRPRCRPLPAHVVEAVADTSPELSHPELLDATVGVGADTSGVAGPHAAVLADLFDREVADRIAPAQRGAWSS